MRSRVAVVNSYRRKEILYSVLQLQYQAEWSPIALDLARAELLPFLLLHEQEGLAAFVEYTLFEEFRSEANIVLFGNA
jgi:hypothetical protein